MESVCALSCWSARVTGVFDRSRAAWATTFSSEEDFDSVQAGNTQM